MKKCAVKFIFLAITFFYVIKAGAQPYFDVAGASILRKPGDGRSSEWHGAAFLNIPLTLNNNNKIIPGIQYEERRLDYKEGTAVCMTGMMMPVTWYHAAGDSGNAFTLTFISRFNSTNFEWSRKTYQAGGAFIYTWKVKTNLKIKAGLYYNREFFSDFFVPLAGLDWKITPTLSLFGVLPNALRIEKKFTAKLTGGGVFRSFTNSFRDSHRGYYKVEDNHLGVYADFYLPANITLSAEAGHSVFKRIRDRSMDNHPDLLRDGMFFKAGISYRVKN